MAVDEAAVLDDLYSENPDAAVNRSGNPDADKLLDRLRAQTSPIDTTAGRPPMYNAPDRWFARRDGHIVKLQGDAASQAYYTSKGYHLLTPQETAEWEQQVRPLVVREQRKRASLITTLRRIAAKHPGIDLSGDLDITPTDELEEMLAQVKSMAGDNVRVIMGRNREEVERDSPLESGVSLSSGADLQEKLSRSEAARQQGRVGRAQKVSFQGDGSSV